MVCDSINKLYHQWQAEIDGGRGIAVMLFHVEGKIESLVVYQTTISRSSSTF